MRKNPTSQSGLFNPRVLTAFALCSVTSVKAQVNNPVIEANFRNDVSANGSINTGDVGATKAQAGNTVP